MTHVYPALTAPERHWPAEATTWPLNEATNHYEPPSFDAEDLADDGLPDVWQGVHPLLAGWCGYTYEPTRFGWEMLFLALIGIADCTGEPEKFWMHQSYECACHRDSVLPDGRMLMHCNCQDGEPGGGPGHPNMSIPLPGGDVFEVTWDELVNKTYRTTMSHELTVELAKTILEVVWVHTAAIGKCDDLLGTIEQLAHNRGQYAYRDVYPQLQHSGELVELSLEAIRVTDTTAAISR